MRTDDWKEVFRHFDALCDLAPEQRQQELAQRHLSEQMRNQLEELLAHDKPDGLDRMVDQLVALSDDVGLTERIGQCVGPYRLERLLGEGGMGEVYLARRIDGRFEARVAVKFLAVHSSRGWRLFDRERRVLARLSHPAIARLIDAGEDDRFGAYLLMEFVDGRALNEVVQTDRPDPATILHWICETAEAVAHAHQNLILHRDLKPEHLLLCTDGSIRMLDFGVAGLLEGPAEDGDRTTQQSFTPRYAAPEQLLGQSATTGTDVYALGTILYELLSGGSSPFGRDPGQWIARKLAGQADPLPGMPGLNRRQNQDLALVLKTSMARALADRYASTTEFARDLKAIMNDQPIALRPPAWTELAARWWRHHRLAGVSLLFALMALIAGSVSSSWFALRAHHERDSAMAEADKAREIAHFMESLFAASSPGLDSGPDVRARDLLEHGYARVATELSSQPETAAALELSIARSFRNLGLYHQALELIDGERPQLSARNQALRALLGAQIDNFAGRFSAALDRLAAIDPATLTANERSAVQGAMAVALLNLDRIDEAEEAARRAIELAEHNLTGLDQQLDAEGLLAAAAFARSDHAAAQAIYARVHQLSLQRHGPVSPKTALALHNLGGVAFMRGELETAIAAYRQAIDAFSQYYGPDHRTVAMTLGFLGLSYRRQGQAALAEAALRRSVQTWADWEGHASSNYQHAVVQLLEVLILDDRRAEALSILEDLPVLDSLDSPTNRGVDCRVSRLRDHLADGSARDGSCVLQLALPESVAVFDRYLALATASSAAEAIGLDHHLDLLYRARALLPPDPLLVHNIERLRPADD